MNQSTFFEALGWSLIDSLWQLGVVWIFYITTTRNGRRFSSSTRHALAFGGILAGTLLFFCSIAINTYSVIASGTIFSLAYFVEQQASSLLYGNEGIGFVVSALSYIYLPVLLFFILRTSVQLIIQRNNYKKNLLPAERMFEAMAHKIAGQFGITKKAAIWLSGKVESPLTIGFWKPIVLLPVSMFSNLSYRQIEAVIAHELFHIKRNDYLLNIFLTLSETVLFFNPFAKLLAATVRKERENSCDDLVLDAGFDAWEYSEALYLLGRVRHQAQFALAATGIGKEYLLQRIRRIMKRNNPQPSLLKPFIAFFLCLFVAGFASRHPSAPVLPQPAAQTVYSPVVYYSVEKEVTVLEPVIITPRVKKKSKPVKVVEEEVAPAPPPPPQVNAEVHEDEEVITISFAASPEAITFTMLDPAEPVVPGVTCESPQPYVPKNSFYFTEIDTTAGKKVIIL
ncbi:MAG: M56 family metallopeptidase [Chitinophagaceae bacterium]|nr:M56 family metallopeptidase [Chitinophagaceae bacterium]